MISPGAVDTELPNSVTEPDIAETMREVYEDWFFHVLLTQALVVDRE